MTKQNSSKPTNSTKPTNPRCATKSEKIIRLLKRPAGATIADLQKATGWQAHSVRGFLSGTVKKRMGSAVISEKDDKGVRRYKVAR